MRLESKENEIKYLLSKYILISNHVYNQSQHRIATPTYRIPKSKWRENVTKWRIKKIYNL
jgi:hypothetical protein